MTPAMRVRRMADQVAAELSRDSSGHPIVKPYSQITPVEAQAALDRMRAEQLPVPKLSAEVLERFGVRREDGADQ